MNAVWGMIMLKAWIFPPTHLELIHSRPPRPHMNRFVICPWLPVETCVVFGNHDLLLHTTNCVNLYHLPRACCAYVASNPVPKCHMKVTLRWGFHGCNHCNQIATFESMVTSSHREKFTSLVWLNIVNGCCCKKFPKWLKLYHSFMLQGKRNKLLEWKKLKHDWEHEHNRWS